jgi:hypothetical protein
VTRLLRLPLRCRQPRLPRRLLARQRLQQRRRKQARQVRSRVAASRALLSAQPLPRPLPCARRPRLPAPASRSTRLTARRVVATQPRASKRRWTQSRRPRPLPLVRRVSLAQRALRRAHCCQAERQPLQMRLRPRLVRRCYSRWTQLRRSWQRARLLRLRRWIAHLLLVHRPLRLRAHAMHANETRRTSKPPPRLARASARRSARRAALAPVRRRQTPALLLLRRCRLLARARRPRLGLRLRLRRRWWRACKLAGRSLCPLLPRAVLE